MLDELNARFARVAEATTDNANMLLGPCVINSRSAARLCGNTTRSRLRASITRCRWLATENQAGPKGLVQGTVGENLTGALSGLFQGSAGVGAGIVLVAGLTRFAGLSHMAAAGTSMPVSGIANAAGVASVLSADASLVHWPTMVCISGPALGGVLVGVRVASYMSDAALKLAFAALVLLLTPPVAKRAFDVHAAKQDEKLNNRTAPEDGAHGGDLPALLRGVHSPATSKAAASGSSCGTQVGSTGNDDTTSTLGGQQRSFAPSVALSSRPFEFEWPQHPLLHGICGTGVGLLSGTVGVGVRATLLALGGETTYMRATSLLAGICVLRASPVAAVFLLRSCVAE